jgi:predicted DNA-binding protein (MmcQ/YjbR family)
LAAMAVSRRDQKVEAMRKLALALPGTDEGIACAGTAIEARTVRAGGRAFLFLGPKEMRLKLGKSLAEARRLAAKHPGIVNLGKGEWVSVVHDDVGAVPIAVLAAWVEESHALVAPKR